MSPYAVLTSTTSAVLVRTSPLIISPVSSTKVEVAPEHTDSADNASATFANLENIM